MTLLPYILCVISLATPWWDDFPRIVETPQLDQAQAHHARIGMCAANTDPGWGLYGQVLTCHEEPKLPRQRLDLTLIQPATSRI